MANVAAVDAYIQSGAAIDDARLDQWIQMSDISNAGGYYTGGAASDAEAVRRVSRVLVAQYLNNADAKVVPLRRKTKFCLLLNNFALYKPVRPAVFECLEGMTSIFEKSIKDEGTMPFDSELGRMSEHVLVLLMRVMDYRLKASAVHEFAEHNTQFAIQLLLAILLKEPPYEFELRCNCISGLLGFTQPQAFFGAGEKIEEHSCTNFTEKVDFMLNLMLRLQAIQVVSDVLGDAIASADTVPPLVQAAVNNTMRTIMNIFKFSSKEATQWRQHILLSTTFLDGTVMMYVQSLAATLHEMMTAPAPRVTGELLHSLNLAFLFGAFTTYNMEEASQEVRIFCTFFHDLFQLSIRPVVTDARVSGQVMVMYTNLLHFMCNVDAMGEEPDYPMDGILPELSSSALRATVEAFLKKEVGGCGLPFTQAWYQQFRRVTTDTLLAQDSTTFQCINSCFLAMITQLTAQQAVVATPAAPARAGRLLGDMPALKPEKKNKISIDKAAAPIRHKVKPSAKQDSVEGVDASLLCALTGTVMKNPVSSPYGQTYEKEAILSWLEQNGSVCPITGRPLTVAQLTPNTAVATRIMQQMVRQTMATQPVTEDDMYNF
ncbi:U-box domain protein [Novymonas esmeraldas]|uniref:U-box domain protein n=1 Tax=Novymonas esmeraldas TaxID=1808958 RepID=A0AAW0EP49_9TRYP